MNTIEKINLTRMGNYINIVKTFNYKLDEEENQEKTNNNHKITKTVYKQIPIENGLEVCHNEMCIKDKDGQVIYVFNDMNELHQFNQKLFNEHHCCLNIKENYANIYKWSAIALGVVLLFSFLCVVNHKPNRPALTNNQNQILMVDNDLDPLQGLQAPIGDRNIPIPNDGSYSYSYTPLETLQNNIDQLQKQVEQQQKNEADAKLQENVKQRMNSPDKTVAEKAMLNELHDILKQ